MYGEDIDLSVRIKRQDGKLSICRIPGSSTLRAKVQKSKFQLHQTFYQSMSIYVGKHYTGWYGGAFRVLIRLAIWLTAGISFIKHNVLGNFLLIMDFALTFGIQTALKKPGQYFILIIRITMITWLLNCIRWAPLLPGYFSLVFGHYDLNWKPRRQWTGLFLVLHAFSSFILSSLLNGGAAGFSS